MTKLYISLGTNLGDKEQNLRMAVQKIEERIGHVSALSAFYVTEPWGFESTHSFLNAALAVETELSSLAALHVTPEIEREIGRTMKSLDGVYHDRLIDIYLLIYDDVVMNTSELPLPHPYLALRLVVLEPLE